MAASEIQSSIEKDLANTPYACSKLTRLSGGTANFVYRGLLSTPLPDGTSTVIIKHAEEYLASDEGFKLSAERCLVEEFALRSMEGMHSVTTTQTPSSQTEGRGGEKYQITAKTPKIYYFNRSSYTQIMEDLPDSLDLKSFILSPGVANTISQDWASSLGETLGTWLKSFHVWINHPHQGLTRGEFGKSTFMRDLKFAVNYDGLLSKIEVYPQILESSREIFQQVRDFAKSETEEGSESDAVGIGAMHGDFWSGNILIPKSSLSHSTPVTPLLITDWEMAQVGPLALDLAQMIAELYMLKLFKGIDAGVWLIHGFIRGYSEASGSSADGDGDAIDEEMAFRILIHVGVHLVFWGSTVPGWGDEEQVRRVVEQGRDLIVSAWKRKRALFENDEVWGVLFGK
ncbi:kinase-like domain-containing protein [Aspergillus venezuelensis]